jgi:protein involved in polysaccharide export with SLBB domain
MRIVVGVVVLVGLSYAPIDAQPAPPTSDPTQDPRLNGGGSTKIPVTMSGGTEVMGAEGAATSASAAPIALEQPIDPDKYTCGAGDTFELNFWGQQNFRLKIAADLEGRVFITKVGYVAVAGKSLTTVRAEVNKKVRSNYPGLKFELTLLAPRSFVVHVAENVARPGAYTAQPVERVSSVLSRAGGSTGSRRRILIKHKGGGTAVADLVLYELTGDAIHNPYLLDGDVIVVPVVGIVATISGAVHRPGAYELTGTKDLTELLSLAGGLKSSAVRSLPIRIVRQNQQQRDTFVDLTFDARAIPNRALENDDRVLVRGTDDLQRSVQLIGAVVGADPLDTATAAKRLPFVEGDTVLSLIERAGGIKAPGDLSRGYISRPKKQGPPELLPLDLESLLVKRDFRADKAIQMGDTIVIPAMQYSVRVEGAVTRAGLYPYNPNFGMAEYVAHAGGRTRSARDLDDAKLIDPNGRSLAYRKNLKPSPGDAILVPERTFTRPEIVQIVIAGAGLVLSGVAITLAATR